MRLPAYCRLRRRPHSGDEHDHKGALLVEAGRRSQALPGIPVEARSARAAGEGFGAATRWTV
jgi:hypothetical protein